MINKKAVAILGAILLLILGTVGFLLYQRSKNKTTTDNTTPPPAAEVVVDPNPPIEQTPPTETPPAETPPPQDQTPPPSNSSVVVNKLTDSEGLSPAIFVQGYGLAYLNSEGQLYQASLQEAEGKIQVSDLQELVIPQKLDVKKVLWPDAGNNFIVQRMESGQERFSIYISDRGEFVDMPSKVTYMNWMPGGQEILYVWFDGGKSTLNIANADGSNWKKLVDFWEPDNYISVSPDGRRIAFYQSQNQNEPNKLNVVTIDGKVFKSVVKEGHNYGAMWSPDSKNILYLRRTIGGVKTLWVVNSNTGEARDLGVELASLDKVVWSQDSRSIYAGGSVGGGSEQLHKIDAQSGQRTSLDLSIPSDIWEPTLNSTATALFFRNALDGNKLYYVSLSNFGQ